MLFQSYQIWYLAHVVQVDNHIGKYLYCCNVTNNNLHLQIMYKIDKEIVAKSINNIIFRLVLKYSYSIRTG